MVFASLSFLVRCQQGVSKSSVHDVRPPSTATSPKPVRAACGADQASAGHRETVQVVMLTPRTSNLPSSVVFVDGGVSKSGGTAIQLFFARALDGLEKRGRSPQCPRLLSAVLLAVASPGWQSRKRAQPTLDEATS